MQLFPEFTIDELWLLHVAPSKVTDHTEQGFEIIKDTLDYRRSVRDYILDCAEALAELESA